MNGDVSEKKRSRLDRDQIRSFKMPELKELLASAGYSTRGDKRQLLDRALDLAEVPSITLQAVLQAKIRELFRGRIQRKAHASSKARFDGTRRVEIVPAKSKQPAGSAAAETASPASSSLSARFWENRSNGPSGRNGYCQIISENIPLAASGSSARSVVPKPISGSIFQPGRHSWTPIPIPFSEAVPKFILTPIAGPTWIPIPSATAEQFPKSGNWFPDLPYPEPLKPVPTWVAESFTDIQWGRVPGSAMKPMPVPTSSSSGTAGSASGCTITPMLGSIPGSASASTIVSASGFANGTVQYPARAMSGRIPLTASGSTAAPVLGSKNATVRMRTTRPMPGGIPKGFPGSASASTTTNATAVCAQTMILQMINLPLYAIDAELVPPTILTQQYARVVKLAQFHFILMPSEVSILNANRAVSNSVEVSQIQLRFCRVPSVSGREMADEFPPHLNLDVNGLKAELPKRNRKKERAPGPIDITPQCYISASMLNTITVSWADGRHPAWVAGVWLVRKLRANDLLESLKKRGPRHPEVTQRLIIEKLNDDDEVCTTSIEVSLDCPLGKMRMQFPCRPTTCSHVQCFDADYFLQMNERKPTWICPVCGSNASFESILLDGYFIRALELSKAHENEILLQRDGGWKAKPVCVASASDEAECIDIADD